MSPSESSKEKLKRLAATHREAQKPPPRQHLPPAIVAFLDKAIAEVTAKSQLYLNCESNNDNHLMLVIVPMFESCISSFVYDEVNMEACQPWLGQKVDGQYAWYSLPVAGNRNVDNLARELATEVIKTHRAKTT